MRNPFWTPTRKTFWPAEGPLGSAYLFSFFLFFTAREPDSVSIHDKPVPVSVTIRAPLQLVPFAIGESARERKSSSRFSNDDEPARIPSITRDCSRVAKEDRRTEDREREREEGGGGRRKGWKIGVSGIRGSSGLEHFEARYLAFALRFGAKTIETPLKMLNPETTESFKRSLIRNETFRDAENLGNKSRRGNSGSSFGLCDWTDSTELEAESARRLCRRISRHLEAQLMAPFGYGCMPNSIRYVIRIRRRARASGRTGDRQSFSWIHLRTAASDDLPRVIALASLCGRANTPPKSAPMLMHSRHLENARGIPRSENRSEEDDKEESRRWNDRRNERQRRSER